MGRSRILGPSVIEIKDVLSSGSRIYLIWGFVVMPKTGIFFLSVSTTNQNRRGREKKEDLGVEQVMYGSRGAMLGRGGYEVGSKRQRMMQSNPYLAVGSGATSFPSYGYGGTFPVVRLRGLPFNCADIDIFKFFAGLDIVDVLLVSKKGKFLGEAFVVFAGPMQVEIALQRDRQNMGRRYVEVFRSYKQDYYNAVAAEEGAYEYEVRVSPPPAGPSRAKRFSEKEKLEYTEVLKMRGLPYSVNKLQIIEFFSGYKVIEGWVQVVCRPDGKATGEAFVEFETAEEARRAMAKDKMSIGSRYVELFPTTREEARRVESRSRQ